MYNHFFHYTQINILQKYGLLSHSVWKNNFVCIFVNINDDIIYHFYTIHERLCFKCRAYKCRFFNVRPCKCGFEIYQIGTFASMKGVSKYHTPKGMWLVIPTGIDISNQHSPQGWAYRWHCGSSAFRPDAISAPTTVPGNPSGSPRLRDT